MDLRLRGVLNHPRSGLGPTQYALSTRYPRILTSAADLLVDQDISTSSIRAAIRTNSNVDRLVYVGASGTFLAFLENGCIASYVENSTELRYVHERKAGGAGRTVTLGKGSAFGQHALYVKADSPSLWCITVNPNSELSEPFKLRGDIEGDQESVNFVDGMFARVRGKVATKAKSRMCPIAAVAVHPTLPLAAAAYTNGIIRVWDIIRKQQRNCFDTQLLLGEKAVQIDLHPRLPVLALCTTHGRVLTFNIKSGIFKRTEEPALASSKMRDRKRRFTAMCFTSGVPSYLLLLTSSRKVLVRMVNKAYVLVNSSRFSKPSKVFVPSDGRLLQNASVGADNPSSNYEDVRDASLQWDSVVGYVVCKLDRTGNIYVFQRTVDLLPAINKPITMGVDTRFSGTLRDALTGPVLVDPDTLIVHGNNLFLYQLRSEQVSMLASLPPGDVRSMDMARDMYGNCIGSLIFYCGDDEADTRSYGEREQSLRYVLCTKSGDGENWNVSEPSEGRSGCFLGAAGAHDRILILGNSGSTVSLFSFAAKTSSESRFLRQSRGVHRFKLLGSKAAKVFRTPFASWSGVLYHDTLDKRLVLSKNAVGITEQGEQDVGISFAMKAETAVHLGEGETVLDVRWQQVPGKTQGEEYYGAILTDRRIYFVRDVLQVYSKFEFQSIARMIAPIAPPSMCWMGPSVVLNHGNSLFSISMDGNSDLLAGLSQVRNISALVAALPVRVVYVLPASIKEQNSVSIVSRPCSALSGRIRGLLSLPTLRAREHATYTDNIRAILGSHDISQGSQELLNSLTRNAFAGIAYLAAMSEKSRFTVPPLKRAAFLGHMGDIRSAMRIAESEYTRLVGTESFHEGTELFRFLQKLLNTAFASNDFAVGRRCSMLLGKRGTFTAFVDCEGGHAAVKCLVDMARSGNKQHILRAMRPVAEMSALSSVATGSSLMSMRELERVRRAIRSVNPASVPLSDAEKSRALTTDCGGEENEDNGGSVATVELPIKSLSEISDRLELHRRDVVMQHHENDRYGTQFDDEHFTHLSDSALASKRTAELHNEEDLDSSDEDQLFAAEGDDLPKQEEGRKLGPVSAEFNSVPIDPQIYSEPMHGRMLGTARSLRSLQEESETTIMAQAQQSHALMQIQRNPTLAGLPVPESRAMRIYQRAVGKYNEARFISAQKELDMALRSLSRGLQRGVNLPLQLLNAVVYYQMACRIRIAMEEIAASTHANTMAGRITCSQLATALSRLPLHVNHRIAALLLAVDANLLLDNYGAAAAGLKTVKELGVPEDMRPSLRDKYSACAARGFLDSVPQTVGAICFMTLKSIGTVGPGLSCTSCPAVFSSEASVTVREACPCCGIGAVQMM